MGSILSLNEPSHKAGPSSLADFGWPTYGDRDKVGRDVLIGPYWPVGDLLKMLMLGLLSLFTRPRPSSMSWPGALLLRLALMLPLAASAAEMQDTVKASFVGTWELRSVMMHTTDGRTTPVWGDHPVGRLVYEANGRMFALLMPEARNEASGRGSPEALQREVAGYYGSYVVDSTRHVVTHRVEASVRGAESGSIERTFSLQSGRLTLTARAVRDGAPVTYVLTWERMRP